MLIESGANLISGAISFRAGMMGGFLGLYTPGIEVGFYKKLAFQALKIDSKVYLNKFFVSRIKNRIKEFF